MAYKIHMLKNTPKEKNYKYYSYFYSEKGDYVIYSRDGKRYYIQTTNNSKLQNLQDTPFKSVTEAKQYLNMRLNHKNSFGVD